MTGFKHAKKQFTRSLSIRKKQLFFLILESYTEQIKSTKPSLVTAVLLRQLWAGMASHAQRQQANQIESGSCPRRAMTLEPGFMSNKETCT